LIDLLTAFVVAKTILQGPLSKKTDKKIVPMSTTILMTPARSY